MKHHLRYSKPRDLYPELVQRILADEQKLAASRAKLEAEHAAESTARAAQDENLTATLQASLPAAEPPTPNQPPVPTTDSQISKEKQEMSSTPVAQAKAALRAKASNDVSASEPASLSVNSASTASSDTPDLDHHSRKCQVCRHPHRETIEELFVNWHSPRDISEEFDGNPRLDWTSIYRHARAMGLYAKRSRNLRAVFDLVLESASAVTPTAHGIVALVRAYTALTENNTWVEPERRVLITNHVFRHDVHHKDVPAPSDLPAHSSQDSQTSSTPPLSTQHSSTTAPNTNAPLSDFQDLPAGAGSSFEPPACPPQRATSPGRTSKPNRNTSELKFPLSHT